MLPPNIPKLRRADIDRLMQLQDWGHLKPILRVVRDRGVGLVGIMPHADPVDLAPMLAARPTIVIVADDAGFSSGPRGFDQATLRTALLAADHVMVAVGDTPQAYEIAAAAAAAGQHVLIIETGAGTVDDWGQLLARFPQFAGAAA